MAAKEKQLQEEVDQLLAQATQTDARRKFPTRSKPSRS
jgi:hypothetical protein